MNPTIDKLVGIYSGVMLIVSIITFDEPVAAFITIGLALMFLGPRYIPGIFGLASYVIGIAISLLATIAALILIIVLIGAVTTSLFGTVATI